MLGKFPSFSWNTFQCEMLRAFQHARCSWQMKARCTGCICCTQNLMDSMITLTKNSIFQKKGVWHDHLLLQSSCKRSLISVSPKMFSRKYTCLVFKLAYITNMWSPHNRTTNSFHFAIVILKWIGELRADHIKMLLWCQPNESKENKSHYFLRNFICMYPSGKCCFLIHWKHLGPECGSRNEKCYFKAGTNETHGLPVTMGRCLMRTYMVQLRLALCLCVQM